MVRARASNDVFHAIADSSRRGLLDALGQGEQPVGALVAASGISYSAVSQHLRVLLEVGLVTRRVCGSKRFYRLEPSPLQEVYEWAAKYDHFWRSRLHGLHQYLDRTDET